MRHKIDGNRLGRNSSLRKAAIRDIAKATLIHQRIETTKMKAKEARRLVDRLISLGKRNTLAAKRRAFSILCDHELVSSLFTKTAARFKNRNGGYTRIIPLSSIRKGDNAQLALLELTEREIIIPKPTASKTAKVKTAEVPSETAKPPKVETKAEPAQPPKDQPLKPEKPVIHPKKERPDKGKSGSPRKFIGGIKKIFTKKPSE